MRPPRSRQPLQRGPLVRLRRAARPMQEPPVMCKCRHVPWRTGNLPQSRVQRRRYRCEGTLEAAQPAQIPEPVTWLLVQTIPPPKTHEATAAPPPSCQPVSRRDHRGQLAVQRAAQAAIMRSSERLQSLPQVHGVQPQVSGTPLQHITQTYAWALRCAGCSESRSVHLSRRILSELSYTLLASKRWGRMSLSRRSCYPRRVGQYLSAPVGQITPGTGARVDSSDAASECQSGPFEA